jgi:hypothetical protein
MTDVKHMDMDEFRDLGFLQEANRQFFHPLGLALEITLADEGVPTHISGVWDYREDPEGIVFRNCPVDDIYEKAANVEEERQKHINARVALFGDVEQPLFEMMLEPPGVVTSRVETEGR